MSTPPTTRDTILNHLRYRAMTIAELQSELGVTRNAIMLPLTQLERAGLVRRISGQREGRVGKPSQQFELAPESFEETSRAYQAIAPHLLAVLGTPLAAAIEPAMEAVGKRIHDEVRTGSAHPVGLEHATKFLQEHGAEIEVLTDEDDILVLSHSCPIGKLVRTDRHICNAIAAFLGEATGTPTVSQCDYADKLTCRFRLAGLHHAARSNQKNARDQRSKI